MKTPEEIKKGLAELSAFLRERLGWTKRSNVLSDALAYIQQLEEQVPKWISVEERLPKRNQRVVVTDNKYTWDYGQFNGLAFCFEEDNPNPHKWNWKKNTVRHVGWWMPKETALPEPPKEG